MTMPRAMFRLSCCVLLALCTAAPAADETKDKPRKKEAAPATQRAAKTHTVTIKGSKFSPAALTVKVGDTVVWTNEDDKDHTVNADDKKGFKSDNISPDDEFEHTFAKAGTFKYACRYHPREKATITVEK